MPSRVGLLRGAGLAAMVGGGLWLAAFPPLLLLLGGDRLDNRLWAVMLVCCILSIVGLLGLQTEQRLRRSVLGEVGVGLMVVSLGALPFLLFFGYFLGLLLAVGSLLYGVATLKADAFPQGLAALFLLLPLPLFASTLLAVLGMAAAGSVIGFAFFAFVAGFGSALAWSGYRLWSGRL